MIQSFAQEVLHARSLVRDFFSSYREQLQALEVMDYQEYIRRQEGLEDLFQTLDLIADAKETYDALIRYGSYPVDQLFAERATILISLRKEKQAALNTFALGMPLYEEGLDDVHRHVDTLQALVQSSHSLLPEIAQTYGAIAEHMQALQRLEHRYIDTTFFSSLCAIAATSRKHTLHDLEEELSQLPESTYSHILQRCYEQCAKISQS